jgi:methylenetetrahydrofolate reductase (NADPH)
LRYKAFVQFIRDIYADRAAQGRPVISFEFFPPKTDQGEQAFFEKTLPGLVALKPDYCSVTYGAGGSTRDKTIAIVERIQREHQLTTLKHLTCVGSTRDQIRGVLDQARSAGIRNILALRGDPPPGTEFQKPEGGFEYAADLVRFIREVGGFGVAVAGFPEGHIACRDGKLADWNHLRNKVQAGADFILTQLFFNNADYFELRDHLKQLGVTVPIVPGIISILSASQIRKFTAMCGATIPPQMHQELDALANDDEAAAEFGIRYATQQCEELLQAGVPGLHFYTLNKTASTTRILKNLGLA